MKTKKAPMVGVRPRAVAVAQPTPPAWVGDLVDTSGDWSLPGPGLTCRTAHGGRFSLIAVTSDLDRDDPAGVAARAEAAYRAVRARAEAVGRASPVRFWNFIPRLLDPCGAGTDRYMAFNAGRRAGLGAWLAEAGLEAVAASGVGAPGEQLVVCCLAGERAGVAIENPWQIPAYRYSERFGPVPPLFARATWVSGPEDAGGSLLISGTASVLGEDSAHPDDLGDQLEESIVNLERVIDAAGEVVPDGQRPALRSLRVYIKRREDVRRVLDRLARAWPGAAMIEWMVTDLCREELLVEIEALAGLAPGGDAVGGVEDTGDV